MDPAWVKKSWHLLCCPYRCCSLPSSLQALTLLSIPVLPPPLSPPLQALILFVCAPLLLYRFNSHCWLR